MHQRNLVKLDYLCPTVIVIFKPFKVRWGNEIELDPYWEKQYQEWENKMISRERLDLVTKYKN